MDIRTPGYTHCSVACDARTPHVAMGANVTRRFYVVVRKNDKSATVGVLDTRTDGKRVLTLINPRNAEVIGTVGIARRYRKHIPMTYLAHVMGIDSYADAIFLREVSRDYENQGNATPESRKIQATYNYDGQRVPAAKPGYRARQIRA